MILSSGLTLLQAKAIIGLLLAFGATQAQADNVQAILIPTVQAPLSTPQIIQTPLIENAPVYFGSTRPPVPVAPVVVAPPPPPKWEIEILNNGLPVKDSLTITTVESNSIALKAINKDGAQKVPIVVTTNDPDLPPSFSINDKGQVFWFCIAPITSRFPNSGCPFTNAVSIGTFDFTFTVEDVSRSIQVTVTS